MALIEITSWRCYGLQPGDEVHASPREQDGQPGWLTWVEGLNGSRLWVGEADARELDPPALPAVTRASVEAWLEVDGRSLPDLAEAMWGSSWDIEAPAEWDGPSAWARFHRAIADRRGGGAARIRQAVKRGSLTTSLATDLAHAIGCSVEDLLFHGVDSATAGV